MEHRWGQRVPAAIKVKLQGRPGAIGSGCLRDVSISGAFIETALRLPLLVRIDVDAGSRKLAGWVVRRNAIGIGVEWCEFAPQAVLTLLAQFHLPHPGWRTAVPLHGVPQGSSRSG